MTNITTYRELETWQVAMTFVELCYEKTREFPADERFGMTSQLRRASVSIPCNVAEGWCRHTTPTFLNHVSIALGSHGEIETLIEIAARLNYLSENERQPLDELCARTGQLLNGLHRSLEAKLAKEQK